jgi:molecular chaperone DnaK
MSGTVAIDFGTARTKLAFRPPGGGRPELMRFAEDRPFAPSLFYLPPDDGPALWGDDAEDMLSEDPAGVLVALKRALSRPKVRANARSEAPTALLARLLADLRARAGQQVAHLGGRPPRRAALTAPALFGPDEEQLLREAALAAGFEEAEVVSEPEAAARAWLAETGEAADEVIVLDCGGGTVDWAWLRGSVAKLGAG